MNIVALVLLLAIDLAWISANQGRYANLVQNVQGSKMTIRNDYAALAYLFLAAALVYLADDGGKPWWHPFVVGWIVYGVFNFTNLAMFSGYDLPTGLLDTLWGGVLLGVTVHLSNF
jgi:uncharacterized membrane protein